MIDQLTPAQMARFPEFVEKWTTIGLSTEPADRVHAEQGVRLAYHAANLPAPHKIVWCGSPLSQGLTRYIVQHAHEEDVGASVRASVETSVEASVWASVRDSVRANVQASVWDSVRASVGDSVGDSGYGQHDANWLGFYDYFRRVLALTTQTDPLQGLTQIAEHAGWWLPHQHICWMAERHRRVCRNGAGQLHNDAGPAVEYPDGFAIWALHGVRVPPELVQTPAEQMDPRLLLTDTNAEVRRERVRKIGIERVCAALTTKVLDTHGDYELLLLDLGDGRARPYLKMRNPSIGVYHIEGVAPHIHTVQHAINWRAGNDHEDWIPDVLT